MFFTIVNFLFEYLENGKQTVMGKQTGKTTNQNGAEQDCGSKQRSKPDPTGPDRSKPAKAKQKPISVCFH